MRIGKCFGIACLVLASVAVAFPTKAANQLWEEYDKLISKRQAVGTLGPDLFGDQLSFYSGSLTFTQTDVSLTGNSSLPVAITRTLSIESHGSGGYPHNDSPMGDWDLDLPSISGTFATNQGWVGANGSAATRCSQPAAPAGHVFGASNEMEASEYWHGYHMRLPGGGGGELLGASNSGGEILSSSTGRTRPAAGGPYFWLTSDWTYVSCLPSLTNAPTQGEGFLAVTANGTKYWFNWMATFYENQLKEKRKHPDTGDDVLDRQRLALYATRVEDRFGNSVTYTYDNASNAPVRLRRIDASDGRSILLESNAYGQVTKVTAGTQQWTYEYQGVGSQIPVLTGVVQPDLGRWDLNVAGLSGRLHYEHGLPGEPLRSCTDPGAVIEASYVGTIKHPSGAIGEFTVGTTRFGRSNVLLMCKNVEIYRTAPNDPNDDVAHYPINWDSLALTRKRIYGPGLVTAEWNYGYGSLISWFLSGGGTEALPVCTYGDCIQPQCVSDACAGTTVTSVVGPGSSFQRYTFGNSYRYNEGKLLKVESGSGPDNILSTQQTTYELASSGQAFPTPIGVSPQIRSGGAFVAEHLRPQRSTTTVQQGVTFSSVVNGDFDRFARPLSVTKSSSMGYTKTDVTEYHDDLSGWVLGQVKRQYNADTGIVLSQTDYDPATALPIRNYSFGKLQNTLGYYADGTLRTVTDGRWNTTTLSDWKRGIPQHIHHPDNTSERATVDDNGWITAAADENAFWTGYGYDAMGRMASVVHPTTDARAWNIQRSEFRPVTADDWKPDGIAVGQWRQLTSTGNHRKVTYFDAMWRPVLQHEYDDANNPATIRSSSTAYDISGRKAFQSYPANAVIPGTAGTRTFYDALDRPIRVEQDSGADVLTSHTRYLTGDFATHTINPNGVTTYTAYQAFDQPDMSAPVGISTADGLSVTNISRHPQLGRVNAITKRNATGSLAATRRYVYDGNGQLCKTIEPETGATVMAYDGAGNVSWSAAGLTLPSTTDCDHNAAYASGRRATRYYDERNRLTSLNFPDGNGDQNWKYTADGLPEQIITYNDGGTTAVVNAYSYNQRRLLTGESSSQPGWYGWGIGYGYDANGNLATQTYPSGMTVDFAPNALGQPTRAGDWASGVSYYPNGAIKQFTYGNGLVHSMTQNARQLPARVSAGGNAMNFEYFFDPNGNVTQINDYVAGTPTAQHRYMEYDQLDRLTRTDSAMFGGNTSHRYTYDALDNMTSSKLAGVKEHNYVYANNRLSMVDNNAGEATIALEYDVQGNLSVKNAQEYSFDYGNRLRAVKDRLRAVKDVETYRYDGQGRRVMALATGKGPILSMYSQSGQVVYQHNDRESKGVDHVYLGGSLIATLDRMWATGATVTKYHHTDALGSPVATTDSGGQLVDRTKYEPYGAAIGKTINGVGYTGHVMDGETGLTYMQQRYYDSGLGRFLSIDPVSANPNTGANFNRYKYAANNPYRFTDPDGRYECSGSEKDCGNFDKAIGLAKEASNSTRLTTDQRGTLGAAVAFFGEKGNTDVKVSFGDLKGDFAQINTNTQGRGTVTFDLKAIAGKNPGDSGLVNGLAMRGLHEGDHGVRIVKGGYPATRNDRIERERDGYRAEAFYQKATNFLQNGGNMWAPWNPGDGFDNDMINSRANRSVDSSCYGYSGGNC